MRYQELTSRQNKTVTDTRELIKSKKARDKSQLFAVEGIKLYKEALLSGMEVDSLFFTEKNAELCLGNETLHKDAKLYLVSDGVYEKLTDEDAPQGVLALLKKPSCGLLSGEALKEGSFVLLEDIQNPLNIGAILRCCYSMGFDKVIFSSGCADIYSPKCARAAMGSLFKIKAYFSDTLDECVKGLAECGNRVFCTALDDRSQKLGSFDFTSTDSFVIGNEGHGASQALKNACTNSLYIPMNEGAESLNAATAAAIVMWEIKKNELCKR